MAIDTIQGARFYGREDVRVESVSLGPLRANECRIKVAYAGICGSDISEIYKGPLTARCSEPHPFTGECLDKNKVVLGHEFSGTVVELGPEWTRDDVTVGTRVCIEPLLSCQQCQFCKDGRRPLCEQGLGFVGYNRNGGLAQYADVPALNIHVVPDGVSLKAAAVAEPLSVAMHAVNQANVSASDKVLIVGGGPIGILILMLCRARGVQWCAVTEPGEMRRTAAKKNGATTTYDPTKEDVIASVREATQGGADIVFECAGNQKALEAALDATRPGTGKAIIVSVYFAPKEIDLFKFMSKEKTMMASCCFTAKDMRDVLELMAAKKIDAESVVTHCIALKDVFEKGIKGMVEDPTAVKILIDPHA